MAIEKLAKPIYLLENISTNITSEPLIGTGSHAIFQISAADFGTASVSIEGNTDPTTLPWIVLLKSDYTAAVFTQNIIIPLNYSSQSLYLRAVVSNVGGGTAGIYVRAVI